MIKCFSKSSFLKIVCLAVLCCSVMGNAWASLGGVCPNDYDKLLGSPREQKEREYKGAAHNAPDKAKKTYSQLQSVKSKIETFCKNACSEVFMPPCTDGDQEDYMKKHNLEGQYQSLLEQFKQLDKALHDIPTSNPCGDEYPYGCPKGKSCYRVRTSNATEYSTTDSESYGCYSEEDKPSYGSVSKVESSQVGSITVSFGATNAIVNAVDANGNSEIHSFDRGLFGSYGDDFNKMMETGHYTPQDLRTNESCKIDALYEDYMGSCYSCIIVSALINTFMQVAEKLGPIMQLAGTRLLIIGIPLWLVFYIIQKIVSLVSLEPMKILNDLFKFFFKCLLAYVLITSGVRAISKLMVNPLLGAGADYGIGIVDSVMPENVSKNVTSKLNKDTKTYKIASSNNVDQKVFDKIMLLSRKADAAVSLNFVIGNALICHSYNAGAHLLSEKLAEYTKIKLYFPDFWLMLCGILIWFFAFMLTIGVNFYLLDLSFKIGFALLALPVTLGLWPFEKFKDKFGICIKLIANAAGTFMFLGITTGMSVALISASLGGTDELLNQIKANNQDYVSRVFGFTSGAFILIFFAFFYSHKLISETVSKLADKFFGSVLSGVSPMANKATQVVDMAKKGAMKVAGGIYGSTAGKAVGAVKAAAKNVARNAGRGAVKGIRKGVRAIRGR